jgi:hypothetical protein
VRALLVPRGSIETAGRCLLVVEEPTAAPSLSQPHCDPTLLVFTQFQPQPVVIGSSLRLTRHLASRVVFYDARDTVGDCAPQRWRHHTTDEDWREQHHPHHHDGAYRECCGWSFPFPTTCCHVYRDVSPFSHSKNQLLESFFTLTTLGEAYLYSAPHASRSASATVLLSVFPQNGYSVSTTLHAARVQAICPSIKRVKKKREAMLAPFSTFRLSRTSLTHV